MEFREPGEYTNTPAPAQLTGPTAMSAYRYDSTGRCLDCRGVGGCHSLECKSADRVSESTEHIRAALDDAAGDFDYRYAGGGDRQVSRAKNALDELVAELVRLEARVEVELDLRKAAYERIESLAAALEEIKFEARPASANSSHVNVQALLRIEQIVREALG